MKYFKYGITLERLTKADIELVREKRNSPEIMQFMEYRETISPEMQEKWFESINNFENFFFIVEYKGEKIGLFNDKNIDWDKRTSESGFFIWEKKYINTFVPILTSLCSIEFALYNLYWNRTFIKVLKDNQAAINYVKSIGFQLCEGEANNFNQKYFLTKELFEKNASKMLRAAEVFKDNFSKKGCLLIEETDVQSGLAELIEKHVLYNKNQYIISETKEGTFYHRI